ncbi:MAG: LysM peptidoglycan-binding domain-containing protein [Deltaproteobacteria bacterium]|nr:LysM peptidoglycan-binding domain-containing protein [Deltaproteobacteria bacterium]
MGAAGIGIAIFMALSLAVSWVSGDKARGSLENKLEDEKSVQNRLEKELKDAKVKAASDGQLLRELENKLNAEISEKKRLERALDIEEAQKRIAEQEGAGQQAGSGQKESGADQKAASELEAKNKQEIAMLEARLKAAEDARKQAEQSVTELEDYRARYEKLSKQYAEKGAAATAVSLEELQRKNRELEAKLKEAEDARKSLEDKLAGYDNAFTLARASLRNDKLVLEDERLNAKLASLRSAIDNALASGAIKTDPSTASLSESVKEAETLLEQARARRAEAEAVLNNSTDKDLALLIKELGAMYAGAKKEKEEALLTVGLLQATAKQRSKGQVSSLESRLMSLEQNRRGMEGQLTEAMAAIVTLDETAARLEAGLGSSGQQSEGMLKLQTEIESLRRARENVKMAMENVKGSMQSNMNSETLRMKSEINQLSGSLEQIALINKGVGATSLMGQAGLQEEPLELKGAEDAAILNKKLQGLNLTIEGVFEEAPTAQVIQPVQQAEQPTTQARQQAPQTKEQTTQAEQPTTQAKIETAQTELQSAQTKLQSAQGELQTAQAKLQTAQAELQTVQAELQATQAEQQTTQTKLRAAQAKLQTAQAELQAAQTELQTTQTKQQTPQTKQQPTQAEIAAAQTKQQPTPQTELQTPQTELQTPQTELQTPQAELQTPQAKLQAAQAELLTAQAELQTVQAELQATQAEQQTTQAKLQATQVKLQAAQVELQMAQAGLQTAQAELQTARAAGASPCAEVSEDQQLYESYTVKRGDSLWKIAAEKKIYGNPYLWPILYKYNIETIYNPDIIQTDFALKIKKNPDAAEEELAVEKARRHTRDRRKKGYIKRLRRELTRGNGSR